VWSCTRTSDELLSHQSGYGHLEGRPIIVFVFDVKGLMADISLKGAKFTKINPK
jgi:lipid-binding SYLF domain-containing protein